MKLRYLFALLIGLVVGCSHSSSSSSENKKVDFGVVNLTYDSPSKHDIAGGESCIILARTMGGQGSCELILTLEKSGKVVATQRILPAKLDQLAEVDFGAVQVTFTPHIGQ